MWSRPTALFFQAVLMVFDVIPGSTVLTLAVATLSLLTTWLVYFTERQRRANESDS